MKFDVFSDFHADMNLPESNRPSWKSGDSPYFQWLNHCQSANLILAGDISNDVNQTIDVVRDAARYYDHIYVVDGNHDHYNGIHGRTYSYNIMLMSIEFDAIPNITFLTTNGIARNGSTAIIGACGWYDWNCGQIMNLAQHQMAWHKFMNDCRAINFTDRNGVAFLPPHLAIQDANRLRDHVEMLQDDDSCTEIVVVTHTIPHPSGVTGWDDPAHPFYHTNGSYFNSRMRTVWEADRNRKIALWVFGHTHITHDFYHEHIRFIANPRGYQSQSAGRKPIPVDTQDRCRSAFEL